MKINNISCDSCQKIAPLNNTETPFFTFSLTRTSDSLQYVHSIDLCGNCYQQTQKVNFLTGKIVNETRN